MLNKILILLFSLLQTAFFVTASEGNYLIPMNSSDTSQSVQKLKDEIKAFYYSNQQKELHALLMNHILDIKPQTQNINSNDDVMFFYLKTLLRVGLINEARQFLDSVKVQWNGQILDNNWQMYFWVGLCDFFDDKSDQANLNFNKAIQLLNKDKDALKQNICQIYFYQAMMLQKNRDRKEALPLYLEILKYDPDDINIKRESNRRVSSTYSLQKEHKLALSHINKAILLTTKDFRFDSPFDIPPFEKVIDLDAYTDLLQSRAYTFREMAKGDPDSLKMLQLSLRDAETSIIAFEKHKRSLVFESDLIYSNNMHVNVYSRTIEAITRLYEVTHDDSLLLKALKYAEMDKVSALLYSIQRNKALINSNIPIEEIDGIENMYRQLSLVEAKRYESKANINLNDTALFSLNIELYRLVNSISYMEKELERKYPIYSQTKYEIQVPNLDQMFDYSYQKAIIEYVISNEKLYTFLLIDGKLYFSHAYFDQVFIPSIIKLQQLISNGHQIQFTIEEQHEFIYISNQLYQKLVLPYEGLIFDKPLLIIPDGQLSLIPFEVLIKSPELSKKLDWASLPYLVQSNDISYAYSLTLTHQQFEPSCNLMKNKIFAIAPGYERLAGNPGNQYLSLRDARDKLGLLEGAEKEVKMLGNKLSGKILLDKKASEEAFKTSAGNYRVLHLAMHTLVNNEEPLYSKLVFTPDVDKTEDGLLNTYELAEMKLGADMVVLSACNTGFGKLNSGEGIVGLSRGFFQAGCKSLLATLWSVSDKTSLQIMTQFYSGLEESKPKSQSLSSSKREYLEATRGMLAHPFFWAGFIVIGDDSPIDIQSSFKWIYLIALSGIILLLLGWWIWKKKAGTNPGFQSN